MASNNRTISRGYRADYVYGSAARNYQSQAQWEHEQAERIRRRRNEAEQRRIERNRAAVLKNRARVRLMSPALIMFMVTIIGVMCFFLIQYISLQASVTEAVQEIATLESRYTKLKQSNDEAYNQINASINLDDIKFKAITQLGMTYANEDQVIVYQGSDGDYVHQVMEVGN